MKTLQQQLQSQIAKASQEIWAYEAERTNLRDTMKQFSSDFRLSLEEIEDSLKAYRECQTVLKRSLAYVVKNERAKKKDVVFLKGEQAAWFVDLLDNPPKPNKRLTELVAPSVPASEHSVAILGSSFGGEVYAPKESDPSSIAPELWNAYKDVLNDEALEELKKVILDVENHENIYFSDSNHIYFSFVWHTTKKGKNFWKSVNDGEYNK